MNERRKEELRKDKTQGRKEIEEMKEERKKKWRDGRNVGKFNEGIKKKGEKKGSGSEGSH